MKRRNIIILGTSIIIITLLIVYFQFYSVDETDKKPTVNLQTDWEKILGGENTDRGAFILSINDSSFLILGYTKSFGSGEEDIWLIKIDESGKEIWNTTYGGYKSDTGKAVLETDDNGFLIIGTTNSFGSGDDETWLIKIDESGKEIWNKKYGGNGWDEGNSLTRTSDGSYIIAGTTTSFGSGSSDAWLIKIDESGKEIWNKTYGSNGIDTFRSILKLENDEYILIGDTIQNNSNTSDIWMIKIDNNGNETWNHTYGFEFNDFANQVILSDDDGFVIVGHSGYNFLWNGIIIKTDPNGNEQWKTVLNLSNISGISSVIKTNDSYMAAGYLGAYGPDQDCLIAKISLNGEIIWTKSIGGEYRDAGVWIESYRDHFIVTGYKDTAGFDINGLWVFSFTIEEKE